jgi:hypothetical protein
MRQSFKVQKQKSVLSLGRDAAVLFFRDGFVAGNHWCLDQVNKIVLLKFRETHRQGDF